MKLIYKFFPCLWRLRVTIAAFHGRNNLSIGVHVNEIREKYYTDKSSTPQINPPEGVIMMYDGRYPHGGLADRLRGLLSVYYLCKKFHRPFYINWVFPFHLSDYLVPNEINWLIPEGDISYNKKTSRLCVVDYTNGFYGESFLDQYILKKVICSEECQKHIYSNAHLGERHYHDLFKHLFKPSSILDEKLKQITDEIGSEYYSFSFRFLSLLGDFADTVSFKNISEREQIQLMENCKSELSKMIKKVPLNYKILIASDSKRFLDYIKDLSPRIYIAPGDISHVDKGNGSNDSHLKTFVDFFLLMNAQTIHLMKTGMMYNSGFPQLASILGGKPYVIHQF